MCVYCENSENFPLSGALINHYNKHCDIWIEQGSLYVMYEEFEKKVEMEYGDVVVDIEFCPFCGKNLKKEN